MIAPLRDGNAHGMRSASEPGMVKEETHTGETTDKGGSKEGVGGGMGEWTDDGDKSLSLSRRSSAGKHRPPRPAGKGTEGRVTGVVAVRIVCFINTQ